VLAFRSVGGQPDRLLTASKVPTAWDVDWPTRYIDLHRAVEGPAICGARHPERIAALHQALDKGTSFWRPLRPGEPVAEWLIEQVPSVEIGALRQLRHPKPACTVLAG